MILNIGNTLKITAAPQTIRQEIQNLFVVENPLWRENEKMGRRNDSTPRLLKFWKAEEDTIIVPRGATGQVINLIRRHGLQYQREDKRRYLPRVEFTFTGQLRPYQRKALADLSLKDFATLQAPTGSGKTILALALVAQRKQPTLIIVHTKELLEQWKIRITQYLGIPAEEIGTIGNGKYILGQKVSVGIINSVRKYA